MKKRFGFEAPELENGVSSATGDDLIQGIDNDATNGTDVSHFVAEKT